MRQVVKDFAAIVSDLLPIEEPVYEFGALQVAGQRRMSIGKKIRRLLVPPLFSRSSRKALGL